MFGDVNHAGSVAFYGQSTRIPRGYVTGTSRFHVTPDGRLFVVYYVSDGAGLAENRILEIRADGAPSVPVTIPLKHPLRSFFTATPRAGCAPSWTLDLLGRRRARNLPYEEGTGNKESEISYARVRIAEA